jgi:hypothetical protein
VLVIAPVGPDLTVVAGPVVPVASAAWSTNPGAARQGAWPVESVALEEEPTSGVTM